MRKINKNIEYFEKNVYHTEIEKSNNIVATTLYKNGRIIMYEETTKIIKKIANYGDFEITKVLKRIKFDDDGKIIK